MTIMSKVTDGPLETQRLYCDIAGPILRGYYFDMVLDCQLLEDIDSVGGAVMSIAVTPTGTKVHRCGAKEMPTIDEVQAWCVERVYTPKAIVLIGNKFNGGYDMTIWTPD